MKPSSQPFISLLCLFVGVLPVEKFLIKHRQVVCLSSKSFLQLPIVIIAANSNYRLYRYLDTRFQIVVRQLECSGSRQIWFSGRGWEFSWLAAIMGLVRIQMKKSDWLKWIHNVRIQQCHWPAGPDCWTRTDGKSKTPFFWQPSLSLCLLCQQAIGPTVTHFPLHHWISQPAWGDLHWHHGWAAFKDRLKWSAPKDQKASNRRWPIQIDWGDRRFINKGSFANWRFIPTYRGRITCANQTSNVRVGWWVTSRSCSYS